MKFDFKKTIKIIFAAFASVLFFVALFYFLILPQFFSSKLVFDYLNKFLEKNHGLSLLVSGQRLETFLKPEIEIGVKKLNLLHKNEILVELEDFEFKFSFEKIFNKTVKLKELSAKNLLIKADRLLEILPENKNNSTKKQNDFKIDIKNSEIELEKFALSYLQNQTKIALNISNLKLDESLDFSLSADVFKNNKKYFDVKINSLNQIFIKENGLKIENLLVLLNNSKLKINSSIDKNLVLNAKSDKFYLSDIFKIINSDLIIPNGEALLLPLNSPKGNVLFDISLNNEDLSGVIDVNNTSIKIKDVSNLPINVSDGKIKISKDKIDFQNLVGFYGKNRANKIEIKGDIKDYYKTFNSNIEIESLITNEFFKDYLAPLINNTALYVSKPSRTKIIYKSKNNIMDLIWFAQINKGVDFGVTTEKSALSGYDRAVLGEFNINGDKLDIKNINYYISSNIVRGVKLQPILQMNALMDLSGKLDKVGFAFGREMPCEFLNVFLGQGLFKKGTIKGNINVAFKNDIPYLNADMEIKKTLIPSQRMFIKEASLKADDSLIYLNALGKFKRANYDFKGKIKNGLKPPFVIKNLVLDLDNVDIERILASFNNQTTTVSQTEEIQNEEEITDDNYMFDTKLIRIEDCDFSLQKGKYKELTFGNIKADLTLDENGILKIKSNKFDIAQGISTLKIECDLNKLKYYIRLGVKGIDSNLMAKTLFNLDREITGAANGLIELYGDETLKMNGDVKFLINNGTIGKVGLVEYLLKIASVFRNPIVMVSPATIMDIISIPEGKFDKIEGNIKIKDNVLAPINIKSYSNSLSALVRGKFDLERHDASLRIYTRFSTDKKSMFNILRNLSLNSLANKVKLNSRNDANYYESELKDLPQIEVDEDKTQVFLTQVEGDIEHFNFLSSLKKIK